MLIAFDALWPFSCQYKESVSCFLHKASRLANSDLRVIVSFNIT